MKYEDIKAIHAKGGYRGYARGHGDLGEIVTTLLVHIAEQEGRLSAHRVATDKQQRRISNQANFISMLQKLVTPPDCADCTSEMVLDEETSLYTCDCHGGCLCSVSAPCNFCETTVDAGDYWENFHEIKEDLEAPDYWEQNRKATSKRLLEQGPSAAERAKPVTPKFVVTCQGDWWDGQENL